MMKYNYICVGVVGDVGIHIQIQMYILLGVYICIGVNFHNDICIDIIICVSITIHISSSTPVGFCIGNAIFIGYGNEKITSFDNATAGKLFFEDTLD